MMTAGGGLMGNVRRRQSAMLLLLPPACWPESLAPSPLHCRPLASPSLPADPPTCRCCCCCCCRARAGPRVCQARLPAPGGAGPVQPRVHPVPPRGQQGSVHRRPARLGCGAVRGGAGRGRTGRGSPGDKGAGAGRLLQHLNGLASLLNYAAFVLHPPQTRSTTLSACSAARC